MSHTVRDLERALHVKLLSRTTRTVEVTPAGRVFADLASQVLTELDSAIKAVRSMGTMPQQTLKLGYTIGAGLEIVPKLLRTYRERQPSAAIETEEFDFTDPSAGLRDNLVNAAVVRPPLGLPGLVSVELATERLVACLPDNHPLATRDSLGVADVLPEPIIAAPGSPGPWRDYWLLTDYRSGPAPVVAEALTLDAETHLVSTGAGLSITSEAVGPVCVVSAREVVRLADYQGEQVSDSGQGGGLQRGGGHGHAAGHRQLAGGGGAGHDGRSVAKACIQVCVPDDSVAVTVS